MKPQPLVRDGEFQHTIAHDDGEVRSATGCEAMVKAVNAKVSRQYVSPEFVIASLIISSGEWSRRLFIEVNIYRFLLKRKYIQT